jgi:adenylosuccinate synthase
VSHVIVVDLGYGDAGKGTVVDWLCSSRGGWAPDGGEPVHTVVRFNGGAQAGHNVVTADGRHHTYAQFGSGTFSPGVRTHLSRFMLVDPLALAAEAGHLAALGVPDALARLTVDRDALLTTPYHRAANQARELARGQDRHGSCGMGIGETARYALSDPGDAPRAGDCEAPRTLARKLVLLRDRLAAELGPLGVPADAGAPDAGAPGGIVPGGIVPADGVPADGVPAVADLCAAYQAFAAAVPLTGSGYLATVLHQGRVVFEGAQGVLLDEWRGFHPYTTWSTTTFGNAEALLAEAGETAVRLGVVRSYLTRHGPGPFVTEDPTWELPEPHNRHGQWQGVFRTGHFDAVALRYAVEVTGGVDAVAVTHLDTVTDQPVRLCRRYRVDGRPVTRLVPGPERDLAYAGRLTAMLLRARPEYEEPGQDWPGVIGQVLGATVVLLSRGPTAADKDLVAPLPALTREPAEAAGYLGGRAADRTGHRGDAVGRDAEARA